MGSHRKAPISRRDSFEREKSEDEYGMLRGFKSSVKQQMVPFVKRFNPGNIIQEVFQRDKGGSDVQEKEGDKAMKHHVQEHAGRTNHTPLDQKKLGETYDQQDQEKLAAVRRQFNWFRGEEKRYHEDQKQKKAQQQEQEEREEQERKKREEEEHQRQQQQAEPQGKVRQSIFSRKKPKKGTTMETRTEISGQNKGK